MPLTLVFTIRHLSALTCTTTRRDTAPANGRLAPAKRELETLLLNAILSRNSCWRYKEDNPQLKEPY